MTMRILIGVLVAFAGHTAIAQETKPQQPAQPAPAPAPAQPTLDDLLGVQKEASTRPGKPVDDPSRTELERQLSMKQAEEQFKQAVVLMDEAAARIKDGRDTGLATQRMQEDIIRKLDMIISSAQRQQQQQKQQRQRQQQQNQKDPGQKNQTSQQNRPSDQRNSDSPDQMIDPPSQEAASPRPGTAARGALWGNLPERVRQALSQGDADKYSAMYRKWTEAYYRKLAEEANK